MFHAKVSFSSLLNWCSLPRNPLPFFSFGWKKKKEKIAWLFREISSDEIKERSLLIESIQDVHYLTVKASTWL